MSEELNLTEQEATQALNELYTHVLFNKLAELGLPVNSEEDAIEVLKLAQIVDQLPDDEKQQQTKQANSIFAAVNSAVAQSFPQPDYSTAKLAADLAEDPKWRECARLVTQ
jgi:hypothetical protein